MPEDHPLESIPRGDSARVGRGPVFSYRPPLVDYIKSGEEWQTATTDMFARLSARDIQSRTGQPPVRRGAYASQVGEPALVLAS
jgi:hypothetical protein